MSRTKPQSFASSPEPTFSLEDILSALRHAEPSIPGVSVTEIVQHTGQARSTVNVWLRAAVAAGKVRCTGRVKRQAVDGSMRGVPLYAPVTLQ